MANISAITTVVILVIMLNCSASRINEEVSTLVTAALSMYMASVIIRKNASEINRARGKKITAENIRPGHPLMLLLIYSMLKMK